jgi:enamine deaminase RidA (YjgF/YER057c/UK114 family)
MQRDRRLIASGSAFESGAGYSRAVVDGDMIYVSGTTGFDYGSMEIVDDPVAQAHQCFGNLKWALGEAGATLDDVLRVRYLLAEASLWDQLAPVFAEYFGHVRPAATAMVVGLVDPRMHVEIEVTARRS